MSTLVSGLRGLGIDLVLTSRVFKIYSKHPHRYVQKALHPKEIDYFHYLLSTPNNGNISHAEQYLATLWAVKEATVKASTKRLLFPEIEYCKTSANVPQIIFHGNAHQWFEDNLYSNSFVSVSHDNGQTIAIVILQ